MRHLILISVISLCAALSGCEGSAPSTEASPAGSASQAAAGAEEIPVPADFEDKAAGEISTDNYKGELDKIEGELKN